MGACPGTCDLLTYLLENLASVSALSMFKLIGEKCSDTPCGYQAPPHDSNWTNY
jgi:hypothetical protein